MAIISQKTALGVFAKYWQPGQVKTRLAAGIGDAQAARWYRAMLETTLQRLQGITDRQVVYFSPVAARPAFQDLATNWQLQPQPDGDLGDRIHHFFDSQWAECGRVMVVGSDCPHYPVAWVREAWHRLNSVDLVVGPTRDGGYYLLGLRRPAPWLFRGIDWSTDRVLQQTLQIAASHGLSTDLLPQTYDIDDRADMQNFCRDHADSWDLELKHLAEMGLRLLSKP